MRNGGGGQGPALTLLMPDDGGLVLVHGNGPQVGTGQLRAEAASHEVAPELLDVLVAETQASIGYLLSRSIGDALAARGSDRLVAPVCAPERPTLPGWAYLAPRGS